MHSIKSRSAGFTFSLTLLSLVNLSGMASTVALAAGSADDPGCRGCLQSASGLFARGDNAGAAKLLSEWQAKCPNNLQLALMLNTVLMRLPDGKKRALAAAEQACTIAPSSMLAHFQKAMTLMTMQDGAGATKEFQRVVELDPTSYDAWLALSDLLGTQGDARGARAAAYHAAQLSPSARQSQLATLTGKDRSGNVQGLKQEIGRILENPSTSAETLLIVGEEVLRMGYFDEAAQCLSQAKTKFPDAPQVKVLLPYALYEAGKYAESARICAGAAPLAAILGLNELAQGNFEAGQKDIEKLAAAGDNQSIINLALGNLAMRQGHYKAAIEKFSDAAAKNKNLTVTKFYIAMANLEAGDLKEAIAQARESQQKASGLKLRALAIELMGRLRDGEDNGATIASLKGEIGAQSHQKPEDQALANCALAEAAFLTGDSGRARELYNSALAQQPALVTARVGLARAALLDNDADTATKECDNALKLAPGNGPALAYKGLALITAGDTEGAESALAKAKEESELPATLSLALGKAFQKAGQSKQAAHYLGQAIQTGLSGVPLDQAKEGLKACGETGPKSH